MTSLTTPDGIVRWTISDPASLVAESVAQGDSIQLALNSRQAISYRWADAAARTAQTGMTINSQGYQIDTDMTYRYNGVSWKVWQKSSTAFTPTLSNVTVGATGTNQGWYSVSAGIVKVRGVITLTGAGLAMGTQPTATLPLTPVLIGGSGVGISTPVGTCLLNDAGTRSHNGYVLITSALGSVAVFTAMGTSLSTVSATTVTSAVPFTWATGDQIQYEYSYEAA